METPFKRLKASELIPIPGRRSLFDSTFSGGQSTEDNVALSGLVLAVGTIHSAGTNVERRFFIMADVHSSTEPTILVGYGHLARKVGQIEIKQGKVYSFSKVLKKKSIANAAAPKDSLKKGSYLQLSESSIIEEWAEDKQIALINDAPMKSMMGWIASHTQDIGTITNDLSIQVTVAGVVCKVENVNLRRSHFDLCGFIASTVKHFCKRAAVG